jgi:CO/xanthine dehydrogenase Mo-binding subunit
MRETSAPAMCRSVNNCVLRQYGPAGGTARKAHLFLDCRTKILDQMKPVGDLLGLRCAFTGGLRVQAAAVPADDLDRRITPKPLGRTLDAAVVQYVDDRAALEINHDGPIACRPPPTPVIDTNHPNLEIARENDMRGGRYRPAYVHAIKGGLDKDGNLVALHDHIVGQSILGGSPFAAMIENGVDATSVEGASNLPYAVPNVKVDLTTTEVNVPVLWWRSVGSTHTAYVIETFVDELAASAKRDPVEFRLSMLDKHPRHAAVLKLAAEKAGWDTPLPEGRFRGVALHESFSTYVAEVVEITFRSASDFTVDRVVCAVDCGTAINPDQIRAQMEGGIGFGLGAILQEELTLTGGVVDQENYDTYTPLRINQMPKVEVHIVPSDEPPTGVGEPGVPPIGPAVANALRAATGKTIRSLPITKGLSA